MKKLSALLLVFLGAWGCQTNDELVARALPPEEAPGEGGALSPMSTGCPVTLLEHHGGAGTATISSCTLEGNRLHVVLETKGIKTVDLHPGDRPWPQEVHVEVANWRFEHLSFGQEGRFLCIATSEGWAFSDPVECEVPDGRLLRSDVEDVGKHRVTDEITIPITLVTVGLLLDGARLRTGPLTVSWVDAYRR